MSSLLPRKLCWLGYQYPQQTYVKYYWNWLSVVCVLQSEVTLSTILVQVELSSSVLLSSLFMNLTLLYEHPSAYNQLVSADKLDLWLDDTLFSHRIEIKSHCIFLLYSRIDWAPYFKSIVPFNKIINITYVNLFDCIHFGSGASITYWMVCNEMGLGKL